MNTRRIPIWLLALAAAGGLCMLCCLAVGVVVGLGDSGPGPVLLDYLLSSGSGHSGGQAPDFSLQTTSGGTVRLSDYRGHPVLLAFSASWCPECRRSAPDLQALHERNTGLIVIMIDQKEGLQAARDYARLYDLSFPVALDPHGEAAGKFGVWAIPTEILVDAEGAIRMRTVSGLTEQATAELLRKAGLEP